MKSKNTYLTVLITLSAFIFLLLVNSCTNDITPSLYEDLPKGATPVISSLDPPDQGLAGITIITISGENFSTVPENNIVYFNSSPAEVLNASESQLVVRAPNVVGDDVKIKIAVHKVELFSNEMSFALESAATFPYPFTDSQSPYSVTSDESDNLFFSLVEFGEGAGVKKVTPAEELLDFAPKGGETFYNGFKYGGDAKMYGVRGVRAVFEVTEGNPPATYAVLDAGTAMFDLDFDQNNNIWTGGSGGRIYRVTPDKDIKSFEFAPRLTSLRVYDDHLYVSGSDNAVSKIWKFQIISQDSLGTAAEVFNVSANYPGVSAQAITFSSDGILFIGTVSNELNTASDIPIIAVNSDGSHGEWYPGVLEGSVISFAWGTGTYLYYTKRIYQVNAEGGMDEIQTIIRLAMERNGAPYYGRD